MSALKLPWRSWSSTDCLMRCGRNWTRSYKRLSPVGNGRARRVVSQSSPIQILRRVSTRGFVLLRNDLRKLRNANGCAERDGQWSHCRRRRVVAARVTPQRRLELASSPEQERALVPNARGRASVAEAYK